MKLNELIDIKETLVELWDFFTSNTDSDETGLVDGLQSKYTNSLLAVRKELDSKYLKSEVGKLVRKAKKKPLLIEKDIINWNLNRMGVSHSFSIEKICEKNFSEEDAHNLESYINDMSYGFTADEFNIEYMGHLTGSFSGNKLQLIEVLNNHFKSL